MKSPKCDVSTCSWEFNPTQTQPKGKHGGSALTSGDGDHHDTLSNPEPCRVEAGTEPETMTTGPTHSLTSRLKSCLEDLDMDRKYGLPIRVVTKAV